MRIRPLLANLVTYTGRIYVQVYINDTAMSYQNQYSVLIAIIKMVKFTQPIVCTYVDK